MLHLETVEPSTLGLLIELQGLPALSETRLVGGTALTWPAAKVRIVSEVRAFVLAHG